MSSKFNKKKKRVFNSKLRFKKTSSTKLFNKKILIGINNWYNYEIEKIKERTRKLKLKTKVFKKKLIDLSNTEIFLFKPTKL